MHGDQNLVAPTQITTKTTPGVHAWRVAILPAPVGAGVASTVQRAVRFTTRSRV
jgi:hypothetical protein